MRRMWCGLLMSAIVIVPVGVLAQQASPPSEQGGTLELRHKGPPVIAPAPQSPEAVGEAERDVKDLERRQRDEQLLRETRPSPPRRPDLDYDVKSGIQQKAIDRAAPSR